MLAKPIVMGSAVILFFGALFFWKDSVAAQFIWRNVGSPSLSLFFNQSDAPLAMEIGILNFGVSEYNLPLAKQAFKKAIALDPGILWGHYQLARILFVEGKFDEALQEINQELSYNPENLRSLYVRGLIYMSLGNFGKAVEDFERFVRWAPAEWAGYNDLAWALGKTGRYREAQAVLEEAFEKIPDAENNPWLWNNLGAQELNLGKYKEASESFTKAERLAASLTENLWREAYPGNDPASTGGGIEAFRAAVLSNKEKALRGM